MRGGREESSMGGTNGFLGEQMGDNEVCDNVCLCKWEWSSQIFPSWT